MVRWSYSGIRPLFDDGASKAQEATRDYVLKFDAPDGKAPLLSVFGGKITTYRKLAEAVLEKLEPVFPSMARSWTGSATLPGGDFAHDGVERLAAEIRGKYPFLAADVAERLLRAYGTLTFNVLGGARNASDLGQAFGMLSEREVSYLVEHEWARTVEDILWRRSKLGLHLTPAEQSSLAAHLSPSAEAQPRVGVNA
jgi:glycerol-3-phosphate dehydrogenase